MTGNLVIITLTLSDPHLQTPVYFFLQNFSFLEISFTSVCNPKFLVAIMTGDRTFSYNSCVAQLLSLHLLGGDGILPPGCHVLWPLCGRMQTFALHNHHEQQSLHPTCALLLAGWANGYYTTNHSDESAGLLWIQSAESLFLWLWAPSGALLFRHKPHREGGLSCGIGDPGGHAGASHSLLHVHYQDYSETPLCPSKDKSLFHLFFPLGCHFSLLWKLLLHLC